MRPRDCVFLAAATGLAVGALDGVITLRASSEALSPVLTILGCAAVVSSAAVLLGLVQALLLAAARRPLAAAHTWSNARLGLDPHVDRAVVVRFHAVVVVAACVGVGALTALYVGFSALFESTEQELAPPLALLATIVVLSCAVVAVAMLAPLATRPITWIDRKLGLPRPRSAGLRFLLFVAVPVGGTLWAFIAKHAVDLGTLAIPFGVVLFVLAQALVGYAWRFVTARRKPSGPWLRRGVVGGWLALVAASTILGDRAPEGHRALLEATVASSAVAVLHELTDIDRDGFSSMWGGRDCAPLDANRHPLAADVPDNAIDENCDGIDAGVEAQATSAGHPVFHGELTPDQVRRYNVVWIIIDAARADKMGFLGNDEHATPYLDALAKESVVFTDAYSQSSATMLSMPSMLLGRDPGAMTWAQRSKRLSPSEDHEMLPERFTAAGYRTGVVLNHYFQRKLPGVYQGFASIQSSWLDGSHKRWFHRSATVATAQAIRFIEDDVDVPKSEVPFFLVVYYESPHGRYNRHDDDAFPDFGDDPEGLYTGEIAYADRHIGGLLDYLRYTPPLWDDTIVIVAADHGEEFGEHGGKYHSRTCYREVMQVPLLIRIPGVEPAVISSPVGLVDIAPTLLEVTGTVTDDTAVELDGQSLLVPILAPERAWPDRPLHCAVLSQTARQGNFLRRAVRVGDRVLMHEMVEDDFELYDTRHDRAERNDLAGAPAEADTMTRLERVLDSGFGGNLRAVQLTGG